MTAAMRMLKPIFGADLPDERYAYRPDRNDEQEAIDVDADLADCSGSIPQAEPMSSLARRRVRRS